jgi:hypothetical protein
MSSHGAKVKHYHLSGRHPLVKGVATSLVVSGVWAVVSSHPPRALLLDPSSGFELGSMLPGTGAIGVKERWELHDGKYWQHVSPAAHVDRAPPPRPPSGACPSGMLDVEGESIDGSPSAIDDLQEQSCVEWVDPKTRERCARFDRDRWQHAAATLRRRHRHFCIDELEYPNNPGEYPWIMMTWREAGALCKQEKKRLCREEEWTFACEGAEGLPYPYGYSRDDTACNIDRPWRTVDEAAVEARTASRALEQIDKLWQGEPSGTRPLCKSPLGVRDMTGNVDEWTIGPEAHPSVLKGGYWGPIRARCRPATRSHGEDFAFYQIGFRCCRDIPPIGESTP